MAEFKIRVEDLDLFKDMTGILSEAIKSYKKVKDQMKEFEGIVMKLNELIDKEK